MCCSGPFSAYRKEIIDKVKEKYITQYFLGENCTYGDDRHLTNLVPLKKAMTLPSTVIVEFILLYLKQFVDISNSKSSDGIKASIVRCFGQLSLHLNVIFICFMIWSCNLSYRLCWLYH